MRSWILTNDQIEEIQEKYANGMTQKELAKEYGVKVSLIQKHAGGPYRGYKRINDNPRIKYFGIRKWLVENKMSVRDLAEKAGICYQTLYYVLIGQNEPRKMTIDKVLQFTGMKYEEAFAVND